VNARYHDALGGLDGIGFLPNAPTGEPINWLTVMTIDDDRFGATPTQVREHLETLNIEARPAWKPMHLQPLFAGAGVPAAPVAERIFRTGCACRAAITDRRRRRPRGAGVLEAYGR
jgi:pyridoxal phosphate-dependent aminotransferase EpsN